MRKMMRTLIEEEIDGITIKVVINTEHKYWRLMMGDISFILQDVDLAQVIRAVATSDDLYSFRLAVEGIWYDEKLIRAINCVIGGVLDGD